MRGARFGASSLTNEFNFNVSALNSSSTQEREQIELYESFNWKVDEYRCIFKTPSDKNRAMQKHNCKFKHVISCCSSAVNIVCMKWTPLRTRVYGSTAPRSTSDGWDGHNNVKEHAPLAESHSQWAKLCGEMPTASSNFNNFPRLLKRPKRETILLELCGRDLFYFILFFWQLGVEKSEANKQAWRVSPNVLWWLCDRQGGRTRRWRDLENVKGPHRRRGQGVLTRADS